MKPKVKSRYSLVKVTEDKTKTNVTAKLKNNLGFFFSGAKYPLFITQNHST